MDGTTNSMLGRRAGWITLLTIASVLFSFALTCATPFPALASLAALHMNRRDAFALIGVSWLANQIVGYGFLHYPQTWDSFAWGVVIGVAAAAATGVALIAVNTSRRAGPVVAAAAAFSSSFIAYQFVLYAATAFLPSGVHSVSVLVWIFEVNALAFGGLLILQHAAEWIGLALRPQQPNHAA